jgi:hypothetical protein
MTTRSCGRKPSDIEKGYNPRLSIRPGEDRMRSIYVHRPALRGGLGPVGGVFPPALLANRHSYWLVARTQIRSPSATQSARVPMDNLG